MRHSPRRFARFSEDEVLAELDYVVASVHSVFTLSEAEMTRRIIRAMSNPFVTMLAHPTGRLLLKRDALRGRHPRDYRRRRRDRHLDRDQCRAEAPRSRLALVATGEGKRSEVRDQPDAHRTERFQELWFGIGVARKGWLTKARRDELFAAGEDRGALVRSESGK